MLIERKYSLTLMHLLLLILAGLGAVSAYAGQPLSVIEDQLVLQGIPPADQTLMASVRRYLTTRQAMLAGWLGEDQGLLIRTRFGETRQLHHVKTPQGARRQLTFAREPVMNTVTFADSERPLAMFLRDQDGNEAFQIHQLDIHRGRIQRISDGRGRHGALIMAAEQKIAGYYSSSRNGRDWDLMAHDLTTGESRMIHAARGTWLPLDWSPGAQWMLALRVESAAVSLPYLINRESAEVVPLYPAEEIAAYMDGRFDRYGRAIFLLSNRGREFVSLYKLDLRSGQLELVLEDLNHDIESMAMSPDRTLLALVVNEDGYSRLRVFTTASWHEVSLSELPRGIISDLAFSADNRQLGFSLTSPQHPFDVYSLDLRRDRLTRWTNSETGGIDEAAMIRPQLITYPGKIEADGSRRDIPAWYYRPRPDTDGVANQSASGVVIWIHGGPERQARPLFNPLIQFWTQELGLAVLAPNVRGSQGYGRTYISLDDGVKRPRAVADIGALLDWISTRPELDEQHIGVYGASYGGYMVLAALAEYGSRIRAGVDLNGISHFVTFLRNTSEYRRNHRRAEYGDERHQEIREFLNKISPLNNTGEIVSPLFIAQGLNDPRVPAAQSEKMVASLNQAGREVWYLLARDEGHGFQKISNRLRLQVAVAQFWRRHLVSSPGAKVSSPP